MALITRTNCPTCNKVSFKEIYSLPYNSPKMIFFLENYYQKDLEIKKIENYQYRLIECSNCNLIFQEQIPDKKFSEQLYENVIDKENSFSKKEDFEKRWHQKLNYELKLIQNLFNKKPQDISILEFGAGWGYWSKYLEKNGFNVSAFEVSASRIKFMKKNNIKIIEDLENISEKFDFIYSEETFEHISNPKETLLHLSKFLNDNGFILLRFPSNFLFKFKINNNYQPKSDCAHPLEHINLFKRKSFNKMLKNTNLKTITFQSKFNFSPRNFLKDVKNLFFFSSILIKKN